MGDWKDDLPHGKGEHIWGKFHVFFFFFYTLTYVLICLFYSIIICYWHYSLTLFITTEKIYKFCMMVNPYDKRHRLISIWDSITLLFAFLMKMLYLFDILSCVQHFSNILFIDLNSIFNLLPIIRIPQSFPPGSSIFYSVWYSDLE